jgi:hypothetical protein
MPISQERLEDIIRNTIGHNARAPYPAAADYRAAMVDYLQMAAGRRVEDPEPLARAWKRDHLSLYEIRESSSMTSSDFGDAMESSVSQLLRQQFADVSADIALITKGVTVPNFRPQEFPSMALGEPGEMAEDDEFPVLPATITESASTGQIKSYGATLRFSKAVMATWGGFILDSLADYARTFYLKELELATALLESATLPTKTGLTFNAAGIATAMKELRTQQNEAGMTANWKTETVIVPADLEGTALIIRESMGANAFNIVTLPGASVATTWWMVASATNSPVLRLTLSNGGQPSVYLILSGVQWYIDDPFEPCESGDPDRIFF